MDWRVMFAALASSPWVFIATHSLIRSCLGEGVSADQAGIWVSFPLLCVRFVRWPPPPAAHPLSEELTTVRRVCLEHVGLTFRKAFAALQHMKKKASLVI
jgi:hypothetical protein